MAVIDGLGLGVGTFLLFFFGFLWVLMSVVGYMLHVNLFAVGLTMFLIVLAVLTLSPREAAVSSTLAAGRSYGSTDPFQSYSMPAFESMQQVNVVAIGVVLGLCAVLALLGCALFESLQLKRAKRIPAE